MARSSDGDSVITRAVRILDAFGPGTRTLTLSELGRRARLPLATTSRLVKEMTRHGLLDRDDRRRVLIGTRMWELAERASPVKELRETALQYMGDLCSVVGHSTQLGVLEGTDVLFVERLTAPGAVVNVTEVAGRLPAHASSVGLALLAHAPQDVREHVALGPLDRYTPHTLGDVCALRTVLAEIRRRGFAFCPGHIRPEATGLAVPVRRGGTVVAALGIVVPNDGAAWASSRPLIMAGLALSRALDGAGAPGAPVPPHAAPRSGFR